MTKEEKVFAKNMLKVNPDFDFEQFIQYNPALFKAIIKSMKQYSKLINNGTSIRR